MDFEYTLKLLDSKIHPVPKQFEKEVEIVKRILTEGQGYLTKEKPVKVIFYADIT